MKSAANFKSHPIHPMLVAFPIAFFTGTLVFDILAVAFSDHMFAIVSYYLQVAGIVMALVAAVPGIIDYFLTVPPNSSGRRRATQHGLINVLNVAIFFTAWQFKRHQVNVPVLPVVLEGIGFILLSFAGWLGGTLVFRNQIGVDPRYAGAGKWKEEKIQSDSKKVIVAKSSELQVNQMKLLRINGKRIVLARTETGYVAFDDHCTHRGGSLAGGSMICGTVQCPWHGSQFDVNTGIVKAGPATENIPFYQLIQDDGNIFLQL